MVKDQASNSVVKEPGDEPLRVKQSPSGAAFFLFLSFHLIVSTFLTGCVFNVNLIPSVEPLEEKLLSGSGDAKILLMDLSGFISTQSESGTLLTHPSPVSRIKEELTKASKDPDIKTVILRINSPGGTVTASDIIYHELINFKKRTGKKIIANIMDVGASGGYYVAVSADKIIAHPTTITGSIGVIMINLNMEGLLEKIGVSGTAIKSGKNKDMGSPFRSMTDEERSVFQEVIDDLFNRFVTVVAAGRPELNEETVRKIADGRIYTAHQAVDLKLIDEIGYLDEAIEAARKEAGVREARVVTYSRPGSYKSNIYSLGSETGGMTLNIVNLDLRTLLPVGMPQFMYLWTP